LKKILKIGGRTEEAYMTSTAIDPRTERRLFFGLCILWTLLSLAARPALGQQVHQLSYNNSYWADQNLNGAQSNGDDVAAFLTTPNNQSHVYYVSPGYPCDMHQLYYNGVSWSDEDLTILSGGPSPVPGGPVTGYAVGNYQYVYYLDIDFDVHQLLYNNFNWVDTNLTTLSGGQRIGKGGANVIAFTTSPALHVYFTAEDNDVHQLFSNDGNTWQDQDVTVLAGLPSGAGGYLEAGFNTGNLQYLHYQDFDQNHLHQLSYNNSKWSDEDLTVLTKTAGPDGSVTSFVIPGTKKLRIYFPGWTGSSDHIFQLASSNGTKWTVTDLTKKSKGPLPGPIDAIMAYATTPNDQVHVFYTSNSHVDQLFQPNATTWVFEDLTSLGNGAYTTLASGLAGFSLQNEQFVFYQAQ
jgi:hypothetical protein